MHQPSHTLVAFSISQPLDSLLFRRKFEAIDPNMSPGMSRHKNSSYFTSGNHGHHGTKGYHVVEHVVMNSFVVFGRLTEYTVQQTMLPCFCPINL